MNQAYFIGIDIGTQGARVVLVNQDGHLLGAADRVFEVTARFRVEQDPQEWWDTCLKLLRQVCKEVGAVNDLLLVSAITVTSTSGTVIPLDKDFQPLHGAIMYSDGRSVKEAERCRDVATAFGARGYTAFNTSCGLPKMLWYLNSYPGKKEHIRLFVHAADYITGKLSGNFSTTDYTNVLKSGYDLHQLKWPAYVTEQLYIPEEWLQQVVPSGTPIGYLQPFLAAELGLPPTVRITVGITDGCASQVAAGAVEPGNWNTTIGTTLVVKGVTYTEIEDPEGALYCHRHPEGLWMPGGASNTGADWVSVLFSGEEINVLSGKAADLVPTSYFSWPLLQQGERFPFVAPQAKGFMPEDISRELLLAANMEGVAYIERYAYERIKELSGEKIEKICTAGGGSNNDIWLKIRSNILNLPVYKMKHVTGANGAAVVAAASTHFNSLRQAARSMVHAEKIVTPDPWLATVYNDRYQHFINLLKNKGYIF
ncbi:FGGY-family carbohydrate kinase [Chitinophaga sp. 30R24]|uniref:FGGY-family carbohydrate kinase n=1 Tax=Chitinophaga sp. 30R24 TaxID=3248838 RepID=UPI003B91FAE8